MSEVLIVIEIVTTNIMNEIAVLMLIVREAVDIVIVITIVIVGAGGTEVVIAVVIEVVIAAVIGAVTGVEIKAVIAVVIEAVVIEVMRAIETGSMIDITMTRTIEIEVEIVIVINLSGHRAQDLANDVLENVLWLFILPVSPFCLFKYFFCSDRDLGVSFLTRHNQIRSCVSRDSFLPWSTECVLTS